MLTANDDGSTGPSVTYSFSPSTKKMLRTSSDGTSKVLLNNCNLLSFQLFTRCPSNAVFGSFPVAVNNWQQTVKVLQLTWKTSMTLPSGIVNSENIQTARIVIRKQQDHLASIMKIRLSRKLKQMASALLVVMVLGGILCLFVMYYLSLIQQQNTLSVRSQAWNIAIAVSEAGIEEGLQALNSQSLTPSLSSADGWHLDATGTYYWRTNTNASLGGNWYTIAIRRNYPIAYQHEVTCPGLCDPAGAGGQHTRPCFSRPTVSRQVPASSPGRCGCAATATPCFLPSLVAKHKIDLKGNGVLTDSFDSEDLWKSYYGQYDADVYAGDKGDIASNDGVVGTISVQNAKIYGKAHTGPEGTVDIVNQGWVGTHPEASARRTQASRTVSSPGRQLHLSPTPACPIPPACRWAAPKTIVTVTYDYSKTTTNSTVYPNPPPWSGVTQTYVTTPANHQRPTRPRHLRRLGHDQLRGQPAILRRPTPTTTSSAPTTLTRFTTPTPSTTTNTLRSRDRDRGLLHDRCPARLNHCHGRGAAGAAQRPEHERQ